MGEWQPIETCPKNEREAVLVYWAPHKSIQMAWWGDLYDDEGLNWYTDNADYLPEDQLTHWMPLPKPPVTP